jgi:competence CoiA-like predicted nuclease
MPFVALGIKNETERPTRIDITRYQQPKQQLNDWSFKCQICGWDMIIRHTLMVSAHFAHKPNKDRTCLYDSITESEEHRAAKQVVAETLRKHTPYEESEVLLEYHIAKIQRIADVLVKFPDKSYEVHEIQLSAISTDEIAARTEDYLSVGIQDVIWWLGKDADTATNREWTKTNYGYVAVVETQTTLREVLSG